MNSFSKDFPILSQKICGHKLVYLDNAATTQPPASVIHKLTEYYAKYNSNVFRGNHYLSRLSSEALETTRLHASTFLGAASEKNIIFTSGATESINIVARGLRSLIGEGDEIVVSVLEHHSNFVPWQQLCKECGATLKIIGLKNGSLDLAQLDHLLNPKVRLVAITEVSNVTGEHMDIQHIIKKAHMNGSLVFVDGAQGVRHTFSIPYDCDFYCISTHKFFGPAGTGILYGKTQCLEMLQPSTYGGGMIHEVTPQLTTYGQLPHRLEAGTPNYPGIIAFNETLNYLEQIGTEFIQQRETFLMEELVRGLSSIKNIHIAADHIFHEGILSFEIEGVDAYDAGILLDHEGIAVRTGSHCAQPTLEALHTSSGLIRISPAFYNTEQDIQLFMDALKKTIRFLDRKQHSGGTHEYTG